LTPRNRNPGPMCNGEWDHHDHIFRCLRAVVPQLDQSIHALVTDLHERGLARDVAVVVWGEMGRTPRVGTQRGTTGGRDHWPQSGFALMAGGGPRVGEGGGGAGARGAKPRGGGSTPPNGPGTPLPLPGAGPGARPARP